MFAHPASEKDRKRENQLARSHTARVNRENRLPTRSASQSSAPTQPKKLARRAPSKPIADADGGGHGAGSSDGPAGRIPRGQQWEEILLIGGRAGAHGSSSSSSSSSSSTQADDDAVSSALMPKPRTIAPMVGAQSSATFQLGTSPTELARAAHYCMPCPNHSLALSLTRVRCRHQGHLARPSNGQICYQDLVGRLPRTTHYFPLLPLRSDSAP